MKYMQAGDYIWLLGEVLKGIPREQLEEAQDPYGEGLLMDKMQEALELARLATYQMAANERSNDVRD